MPTIKNNEAEIYYDVTGPADAPALVFAHGRGGNAASWWQQVPHFADRYRCVTFDHRAFGRSTCAPENILVRHYVADLEKILEDAEIGEVAIVCQSMGGWTGLRFAIAHPERVRCLVLGNTPGGVMTDALRAHARTRPNTIENADFNNYALAPDYHEREPVMGFLYNQIGAFNRLRADRAIQVNEALDEFGRQKAQLERDTANVKWLIEACELVLDMFGESAARLDALADEHERPMGAVA